MNPPWKGFCRKKRWKTDSFSWGGQNVYDVYSLSESRALDGTYYKDW